MSFCVCVTSFAISLRNFSVLFVVSSFSFLFFFSCQNRYYKEKRNAQLDTIILCKVLSGAPTNINVIKRLLPMHDENLDSESANAKEAATSTNATLRWALQKKDIQLRMLYAGISIPNATEEKEAKQDSNIQDNVVENEQDGVREAVASSGDNVNGDNVNGDDVVADDDEPITYAQAFALSQARREALSD